MPKPSISSLFDKRISRVEDKIGINEDGTLNGNGFINTMNEIKEQLNGHETYLDNISEDMIKIDHRLEKLEILAENTNHQHTEQFKEIQQEQQRIVNDVKEIKKCLDDSVTGEKIAKSIKILFGIAGTITALGTILGTLYFFTNKFMG